MMKIARNLVSIVRGGVLLVTLFGCSCAVYGDYKTSAAMVANLQQYLGNVATSQNVPSLNASFLSQVWTSSFDAAWPSSNGGNYLSGKLIPPEAASLAYADSSSYADGQVGRNLSSGRSPVISSQTEFDSLSALAVVIGEALNDDKPDCVPQLFKARQNILPVTKGDMVIYNVIYPLKRKTAPFTATITAKQLSCWKSLSQAKNPIYRLVAAQVFPQVVENYPQWNGFYSSYASETDPDIAKIVVTILGDSNQKSLISTLLVIQAGQTSVGNATVAQLAATTIQNLRNTGT
jgi:hypothetical protein